MSNTKTPPQPVHVAGMHRGEELATEKGKEAGRDGDGAYRTARDSTGINPEHKKPIHPAMPHIPPA